MTRPRPLPYPLDYSETASAITPSGEELPALPAFSSDSDERVILIASISLNEFVKIASTVDVGNDIAYPDDSVGVWYLWSRIFMADNLCTLIAACIADPDSDTYDALNTYLASENATNIIRGKFPQLQKGLNAGLPPDEEVLTSPLGLGANPSCDLDVLWAQCLAVVVTVSQAMIDFMEQVEVATNAVELGNALISSVPIVSALAETVGANGWLDVVNYFQEAFAEGFIAGYTETPNGSRDTLACALFCLCRDDCVVTIDRIFTATLLTFGESVPDTVLESLQAAAEYISGISLFSAESSYYATMFVAALMAKAGSAFLPALTQGTLNLIIALAADEPSNDWSLLCDCSVPTKDNIPAYGRGYSINGGDPVVVNPITDNSYIIPSVPIGGIVTLVNNGGATAIGDCASSYQLTVEITYVDGYSYRRIYGAGSCSEIGTNYNVGDVFADVQVNGFGSGATGFKILA